MSLLKPSSLLGSKVPTACRPGAPAPVWVPRVKVQVPEPGVGGGGGGEVGVACERGLLPGQGWVLHRDRGQVAVGRGLVSDW